MHTLSKLIIFLRLSKHRVTEIILLITYFSGNLVSNDVFIIDYLITKFMEWNL